jgi:hypothetical protein
MGGGRAIILSLTRLNAKKIPYIQNNQIKRQGKCQMSRYQVSQDLAVRMQQVSKGGGKGRTCNGSQELARCEGVEWSRGAGNQQLLA